MDQLYWEGNSLTDSDAVGPINEHPIEDERFREQGVSNKQIQQLPHREGIHHQLRCVDDIINQ